MRGLTRVGPVLEAGDTADAVVRAIRALNRDVEIQDRGAYLRVLVPERCVVTRKAIEQALGRPFHLTRDLEQAMPSFKGSLALDEERAVWSAT